MYYLNAYVSHIHLVQTHHGLTTKNKTAQTQHTFIHAHIHMFGLLMSTIWSPQAIAKLVNIVSRTKFYYTYNYS